MRRRTTTTFALCLLLAGLGCGIPPAPPGAPKTALEKQRQEDAKNPELADAPPVKPPKGKNWSGWRLRGDRDECFFVVGRVCHKTREQACSACKSGRRCHVEDGAPSIVTCKKPE